MTVRSACELVGLVVLLAVLRVPSVSAAPATPAPGTRPAAAPAEPGSELSVYLLTMSPGSAVYERFGHNALWVRDRGRPGDDPFSDVAYNWGIFDFEQENFVWRFIHGRMMYSMAPFRFADTYIEYRDDNRAVWAQELNLSPNQRLALKAYLERNARPENRDYKYDYYRDNCSTRVRDAIDAAVGGQLEAQLQNKPTGTTYRWHTRRLTADSLWWTTALTYVLGQPVDQELSAWEECFLPGKLREHVQQATILDEQGQPVPLVVRDRQISATTRPPEAEAPPDRLWGYLAAGTGFGAVLLLLAWRTPRGRVALVGFVLLAMGWTLLNALGGTIAAYAWLVTDHAAGYRNENLFQLNPLAWPLFVLVPALALGTRPLVRHAKPRTIRTARAFAWALATLSFVGLAAQALPSMDQANGEIIALALPVNLALALAVEGLARRARVRAGADTDADAPTPPRSGGEGQIVLSAGRKRVKSVAR